MKQKILLVDDRPENLVALEKILSDLDVLLYKASSGNEALALCLDHQFALALIDVQMPEMDGYETVDYLRQDSNTEHLPVILVSAVYSENYYVIKGVETGAIDFLAKPIIPEILRGKVNIFLSLDEQRRVLESQERKFRTLYQKTPAMIYSVDATGVFLSANDFFCKRMDVLKSDILGKNVSEILNYENFDLGHGADDPSLEVLCLISRSDGEKIEVLKSEIFGRDGDGYSIVVLTDVTEKNKVTRKLKQFADMMSHQNDEMKQFLSIVSHDLRAPLANIVGWISLINEDIALNASGEDFPVDDLSNYVKIINSSADQMMDLIDKLSELAQVGGRDLKIIEVDMSCLVSRISEALSLFIKEGNVCLHFDGLPKVQADELGLSQVLTNLIKNSIIYRSPDRNAEILVSAEVFPDVVEIVVKDNGIGMTSETRKIIFQPFRRGEHGGIPGEGLGLSYVKTIIQAHGGSIRCESESGVGSSFYITLPKNGKM